MSSPPTTIDHFKGTDWEECNKFILAVRAAAWNEGKLWDLAWMAGLASLHFSHQALFWHARLPQDVRQDWMKLEIALLDRWAPATYGDEPRIEPTPAAAPFVNGSTNAGRPRQGVLKVVSEGLRGENYVNFRDGDITCGVTVHSDQALRVRSDSLSGATLLERIDGSQHSWLGIHWESSNPNRENGSKDYCYLVSVDSYSLKSSWCHFSDPWQLLTCTIATNGEVIPVWRSDAVGTRLVCHIPIPLFFMRIGTYDQLILLDVTLGAVCSTGSIRLAPDPRRALDLRLRSWDTAKIFFEPID